ncbi:hypothetical protein NLC35_03195 [Candidatus Aminicenantes bacterium AC-334-K16]|jgi:hypothetical protein|nr:hypothetical protein [Candidatus Aminicenantes bacterium AC-334-K16]
MRKLVICGIVALAVLGASLQAKDCPSRLYANLHQIGNSPFSWSFELRAFDYNVEGENYFFYGLGGLLRFEPHKNLIIDLEAVYREKKYVDCQRIKTVSPIQIKALNFQYSFEKIPVEIVAGRQEIRVGSGLVLNDFFDGLATQISIGDFELNFGAGLLALPIAKKTLSCQKCYFYEYKSCWKGFCNADYGDFKMIFAGILKRLGPNTFGVNYLHTFSKDPHFDSAVISSYGRIKLPLGVRSVSEFAVQRLFYSNEWAYGFYWELSRVWRARKIGTFIVKLQNIYGSKIDNTFFSPVFGNIFLGERMHYSIRQGNTFGASIKILPRFWRAIDLYTAYFVNSREYFSPLLTDEFDIGINIRFDRSNKIRSSILFSRANTTRGLIHQLRFDVRLTF